MNINRRTFFLTVTASIVLACLPVQGEQPAPATENAGHSLTPDIEMAIIRQLNLEDRIANRQAVLPKRAKGQDGIADVSGEWVCFTTMFLTFRTSRFDFLGISLGRRVSVRSSSALARAG